MSYEAYKGYRLVPDDNGIWSVLDKTYETEGLFPSKGAAKKYIDDVTEVLSNKPTLDEDAEIDHLVSQYGKDPRRFIGTIEGKTPTIDDILLKHRSDAIAIHEGKSNGKDIGDSIAEAKQQLTSLIADIIGHGCTHTDNVRCVAVNDKQAEQRQRAKERGIDLKAGDA